MAKVELYTWANCPYCVRAKNLLRSKKIDYIEHDIDNDDQKREELMNKTNQRTVPFIFINDQFIGGFTDLKKLADEGKLEQMLNS